MTATTIAVDLADGHHRVRTRHGLLRCQRLHGPQDAARLALVGQTALLIGGDDMELHITLGPGATVELTEVAGTVAYDGRGQPARWTTRIRLETGARLVWAGEPLVISDGADVSRSTAVELAAGAVAVVRETLVLGRVGERGGWLRSTTKITRNGRPVLLEDLVLDPAGRAEPGLLGDVRVVDSVLRLGTGPGDPLPRSDSAAASTFALVEPGSTLTRFLGRELADSPLIQPSVRDLLVDGPRPTRAGAAMLQG